jgi:hypothetical protein
VSSSPKSHSFQKALDPVAAYNQLAPYYSHFSKRRAAYLAGVEELIATRIPAGASSLLDIGAGDGSRAVRIASTSGISRVALLEPSTSMAGEIPSGCEAWRTRVEDLDVSQVAVRFDVITCLWNVLGHVEGFKLRVRALRIAAQLLSPKGLLFVDVIHRYNVRSYGIVITAARWLGDHLAPSDDRGDVKARWQTSGGEISTYGHVFTHGEMERLAQSAGFKWRERVVIDYRTGEVRRPSCMGNLLYVLRFSC